MFQSAKSRVFDSYAHDILQNERISTFQSAKSRVFDSYLITANVTLNTPTF